MAAEAFSVDLEQCRRARDHLDWTPSDLAGHVPCSFLTEKTSKAANIKRQYPPAVPLLLFSKQPASRCERKPEVRVNHLEGRPALAATSAGFLLGLGVSPAPQPARPHPPLR